MKALIDQVLNEVREELLRAIRGHAPMNSAHEGYAVIREELEEELWKEIVKKRPNMQRMREEALQVAAMGVRFILDICHEKATGKTESVKAKSVWVEPPAEWEPGNPDCTNCQCVSCIVDNCGGECSDYSKKCCTRPVRDCDDFKQQTAGG